MARRIFMTLVALVGLTATAWADDAKTLTYTYGFENFDLEAEGWTREGYWFDSRISVYAHSGNYCFKFSITETGQPSPQYLISPEIDSEGRDYSVSFYYLNKDGRDFFQVGYSTTSDYTYDFTWEDVTPVNMTPVNSSWTLYEKELPSNVKYIAIVAFISQQNGGIFLDDFTFAVSGCLPPENLTASDITDQSATLTWTAPSTTRTVTGYAYQYKKVSESTWSDEVTTTPTFATISNLLPNTSYDFRVKALYAEGESLNYTTITILTDCSGSVSLPFSEDFENGMGCWRVVNGDAKTEIENAFRFSFWGDGPQYLISPPLNCTQDITVSFYYGISDYSNPKTFQVGYSTTTDDTSAFTWDTEVTATTGDYVKYEHNFPAGTKYIAVKYTSNSQQRLFIDDVSIFMAGVLPPAQVSASTIATQSATLTWDAADGATGYAYQFKKASDVSWSAETTTTETSVTLSNLTTDTDYEFRVKTLYGSDVSFYTATQFTTATALPYEQDFENGMGHWGMVDVYWGHTGIDEAATRNGDNGFFFSFYNRAPQYLISPRFEGTNTMSVSFYYKDPNPDSGYFETFYVGYSTTTNDIDAFTWDSGTSASHVPWTLYENHSFPADTKYIAVKYTSTFTRGLYIDDFSFAEYSTYAKPTTIVLTALTETEAQLIWNDPDPSSTGWVYQYKKASDAAWSAEVTQTTNTVTLSGLTPNTNYNFRVKALYGSNASNYATRSFQTDANIVDLPYSDGFENGIGGWRMRDCDLSTKIKSNGNAHSGEQYFGFYGANYNQYLISPHFAGGTPMKVSFFYKNYANYPALFVVGYTSSKESDITWVNQVTTSSGAWTLYETTVPAEAQYVVICCRSEGDDLFLDDFSFIGLIDLADDADNTTTISDAASLGEPCNIRLTGRTLYRNGDWNTLTVPFDIDDISGTPLEGATVKTLRSTAFSDGTLTLNFEDATEIEAGKPYIVKWDNGSNLTINSTNDWNAFAESVNGGKSYAGKTVLLGADIDVSTMVGTADCPFSGTFEGAGHTLNVSISGGDGAAPFRYVSGATIRNVKTTGTVSGGNHCAGLVGIALGGTNRIRDCYVSASVSGGSYAGGILGNGTTSTTTISNSLFDGSLTAYNMGIFYGWGEDGGTHTVENCVVSGANISGGESGSIDLLLGNGTKTVTNCCRNTEYGSQGDYWQIVIYFGGEHPLVTDYLGNQWTYDNDYVLNPTVNILDTNIENPVFLGVTVDATASPVETAYVSFIGCTSPVTLTANDPSVLYLDDDTIQSPSANMTLGSCRAYFHINDPSLNVQNYVLNFLEKGDMNGDGQVTIADVPGLVNLILSGSNDPMGDINGDNRVSIADVTALVNHLKEN